MIPSPHLLKTVRESRIDISQEYTALCSELDMQKKIKNSFKQHPFLWLGGAVSAGLLTTLLGGKNSIARPQSKSTTASYPHPPTAENPASSLSQVGWLAGALQIGKVLYPILRPLMLEFAQKFVQNTVAKKSRST